jgi:hypothetical protein
MAEAVRGDYSFDQPPDRQPPFSGQFLARTRSAAASSQMLASWNQERTVFVTPNRDFLPRSPIDCVAVVIPVTVPLPRLVQKSLCPSGSDRRSWLSPHALAATARLSGQVLLRGRRELAVNRTANADGRGEALIVAVPIVKPVSVSGAGSSEEMFLRHT